MQQKYAIFADFGDFFMYSFIFVNDKINLCIIREAVPKWKNIEYKTNPNPPEINNGMKVGEVHLFPVSFLK